MTDELDLKTERNDRGSERLDAGVDRADRGARDSDKLSGGRRDRSREMLRQELENSFADAAKADGKPAWKPRGRVVDEMHESAAEKAKDGDGAPAPQGAEQPGAAGFDTSQPPSSWSAEAKSVWKDTPQAARVAAHKREFDAARGAEAIKARWADVDRVLAPHRATIRSFGHSDAVAVERLLQWHQALQKNPVETFVALARSHGFDLQALAQAATGRGGAQQQQQQQTNNAGAQPFDPRQVLQYVDSRLNSLSEQQGMERASAVVAEFARGKPHFEILRGRMAALIASGAVPLKDGAVDLQGAYDAAVRMDPELGEQMIAERIAAEKRAAAEAAKKARHASSSLAPSAPSGAIAAAKPGKRGKSVRESLLDAISDARA